MNKRFITILAALGLGSWWVLSAPPDYHPVPSKIVFSDAATIEALNVDHSASFTANLTNIDSALPGHDDIVFIDDGEKALISGMDGKIWLYDFNSNETSIFIDPPLMAAGLHESNNKDDEIYFCASRLWGDSYPQDERVGLYRLNVLSKQIEPVVLNVPSTEIIEAKVWSLNDARAPALSSNNTGALNYTSRPLAFCNDLEISEDGNRIYFSEPFSYDGASMGGGTIPEALAFAGNGRLWMHDLQRDETRLVAEGYFFIDGILYDLHEGGNREESIVVSLTPGFIIERLFVDGPKAGTSETVQQGLSGMCDGLDRDTEGNVWCAMYSERSELISWIHANPWIKHFLLRIPLNWVPQPKRTGIIAFTPDISEMLYSASYEGNRVSHIASAIPSPNGYIYLTPFSRVHRGLVRIPNPLLNKM